MFAFRRSLLARGPMQGGIGGGMSPRDRLIQQVKAKQQKGMVSDPATYPLIAIVGSALTLATGFILYFSMSHSDVRLNRRERQKLMREMAKQDKVLNLDDPFGKA